MKKIFRYDYNNRLFIIKLLVSFVFLILTIITYKYPFVFAMFLIMTFISFFNSIFIKRIGIRINTRKNKIIISDQFLVKKLNIKDINYVTLKQIPKKTKNKWFGFFAEFFYPETYIANCEYVYNQGKVFNIYFHMNDGSVKESYFGWLYRGKEKKVKKVESSLIAFIERINTLCKENRSKK